MGTSIKPVYYIAYYRVDKDKYCNVTDIVNKCLFYSMQAYTVLLNTFISIEIIYSLKNPISKIAKRLKTYKLVTVFTTIACFLIIFTTTSNENVTESLKDRLFHSKILVMTNIILFIFTEIIGMISTVYLFNRFCRANNIASAIRNTFVIRHLMYYIIYTICLFPYFFNSLLFFYNRSILLYYEYGVLLYTYVGFFMFFIRASETDIYYRIKRFILYREIIPLNTSANEDGDDITNTTSITDIPRNSITAEDNNVFDKNQPLTEAIYKTMNLEFMCCILYGLTEIFDEAPRNHKSCFIKANDLTVTLMDSSRNENNLSKIPKEINK